MKLNYIMREARKKSESNKLRREGSIPAVLYSQGQDSKHIAVSKSEFSALLRTVQTGRLSTTAIELQNAESGAMTAILKDIQYHPTTYDVLHLDFELMRDDAEINVKVPIELVGAADCVGVKLGGVLRPVKRGLRVRCLPKDIPAAFFMDVRSMALRQSRRLKELEIPKGVKPLDDLNDVAVIIAKR
jgi:large subunit ribosomal protein L25